MTDVLHTGKLVHIIVDVQHEFCRSLNRRKARQFPDDIIRFANMLAPEVPTVCVAYGEFPAAWIPDNELYRMSASAVTERRSPEQLVKEYGLPRNILARGNSLFIKDCNDAFLATSPDYVIGLGSFLEKHYPNAETIIETGMNSDCCVPMTLAGGLNYKCQYNFIVITDLLADNTLERAETAHPLEHKGRIQDYYLPRYLRQFYSADNQHVTDAFSRTSYQLSQNFLHSLGKDSNSFTESNCQIRTLLKSLAPQQKTRPSSFIL